MDHSPFGSALIGELSRLVNRWNSHDFQLAHASQLRNERDFTANKVLYLLGSNGPMRPSELASDLGSGRANVSKVVARLLADGLVIRTPDPSDSRAHLVGLTESGWAVSRDVFAIGDEMVRELTADWTAGERSTFTELLVRINAASDAYQKRMAGRTTTARTPSGERAVGAGPGA